jgi:hypothetical protein
MLKPVLNYPFLLDNKVIYPATFKPDYLKRLCQSIPIFVYTCLSTYYPEHEYWSDNMLDERHLDWLIYRCNLMRDTTKASLDLQESPITAWTIVVRDYPDYVISKLSSILGSSSYSIRFLRLKDALGKTQLYYRNNITVPSIRDDSKQYLHDIGHTGEYVISRIDSDDEYTPSFGSIIRISASIVASNYSFDKPWLLQTPIGRQVQYPELITYATTWPNPAFVNLLMSREFLESSKFDHLATPYSFPHDNPTHELGNSVISSHVPMWNMNIHSSNIQNSLFPWSTQVNQ